ncbi:GGDEF domain-containing protein [Lysinibacillus sp. KU-BSD001]|uniref:sensor domain-containing diguanylate cyclase n=1 Tax=Lysinibacillus sp. KU-BSD001 TaxID=3141328 RepID=UPI0036EDADD2
MSTEMAMRNVLVFVIPSIYLYILGTYMLVKSFPYKRARLLATSIFFSAIGYTFDYISVLVPTEFSRFLHLYIVLVAFNLCFVLIIHIIYDIVKTMKLTKMSWMPHVLYGFCILMLGVGFLESAIKQVAVDNRLGQDGSFGYISAMANIGVCAVILVLLYVGYKYAKTTDYRLFFKVCISFTTIMFAGVVLWQLDLIHLNYVMPATPALLLMVLICTFISYLMVKLNLVSSAVKRYSSLMETSATPIVILDKNKRVLEVNESGKLDYHMRVNTDFRNYFNYTNEPTALDYLFAHLDEELYIKGYRINYLNEDGVENIVLIDASKVNIADETYYYCMVHEVTLEFQRRNLNEHLAHRDVLTGIYNRTYFEEEVKRQLAQSRKKDGALMICDLNFFKEINDTYGHQTGDNVLIFTANCWGENLPKPHILARLGGDEFVMFFEQIESKEKFLKQINEARYAFQVNLYKQDDIEIEIVPSIGIVFVEEDGIDYEHLYHTCDVRMYEDKKNIKEQYLMK